MSMSNIFYFLFCCFCSLLSMCVSIRLLLVDLMNWQLDQRVYTRQQSLPVSGVQWWCTVVVYSVMGFVCYVWNIGVEQHWDIVQEEVFGPVVTVQVRTVNSWFCTLKVFWFYCVDDFTVLMILLYMSVVSIWWGSPISCKWSEVWTSGFCVD